MKPEELRKFRKQAKLTQTQLANLLNCTQREISVLETGKRKINKIKSLAIISAITLYLFKEHGKTEYINNIPTDMLKYVKTMTTSDEYVDICST